MYDFDLTGPSALVGCLSAAFWFYSATSISREKELARRKKLADATGETPNLGGVQILDGEQRYDLIATLRHQARWSKWGAILAAIALLLQAADKYV